MDLQDERYEDMFYGMHQHFPWEDCQCSNWNGRVYLSNGIYGEPRDEA